MSGGKTRQPESKSAWAASFRSVTLDSAIDGLYRTFTRYPLRPHVQGCPHCVSHADHARLHSAKLRDLQPGEIARFTFKVMTTWGDADDFRHFLPRIFELISNDAGGDWIDPEVAFGKLSYGEWRSWPDEERLAVETFLIALWADVLSRFPCSWHADSCLCCIAQATDDIAGFLAMWRVGDSLSAAEHFADFVMDIGIQPNGRSSRRGMPRNPWWKDRVNPLRQLHQWLHDPQRTADLERAFHASADNEDRARRLSDARSRIEWLQSVAEPRDRS